MTVIERGVGRLVLDFDLALVEYLKVAIRVVVLLILFGRVYGLPVFIVIIISLAAHHAVIQQVVVHLNGVQRCLQFMTDALRLGVLLLRELGLIVRILLLSCRRLAQSFHFDHALGMVRPLWSTEREWEVAGRSDGHLSLH